MKFPKITNDNNIDENEMSNDKFGRKIIMVSFNRILGVRSAVQPLRMDTVETRRGFLGQVLRFGAGSAIAAGIGAPIFNLAGCGSDNVDCVRSVGITNGTIVRDLMKKATMSISGGKIRFTAEIPMQGRLDELALDGELQLALSSGNTLLGIDKDGNFVQRQPSDIDFGACGKNITKDCSPFAGTSGLVPIGLIKTVRLPENIAQDKQEALKYAVGGKILQGIGEAGNDPEGRQITAVFKRMTIAVYEDKNLVQKPVFKLGNQLVVELKAKDCASDDFDKCASNLKFFKVNPDGTYSETEVVVKNRADLIEAFSYYRIYPGSKEEPAKFGMYWDLNADGTPKPDPSLAEKDFKVLLDYKDPNNKDDKGLTAEQLFYKGRQDYAYDVAPIAKDVKAKEIPVSFKVKIVDLRMPAEADEYLTPAGAEPLASADPKAPIVIPRKYYSNGDFNFKLVLEFAGADAIGQLLMQELYYAAAIKAKAKIANVPEENC
ncbi:hypothetical protein HZC34_00090 [Candidatus Saganbacteria bacterium]|nr:hypothetical protein [Candidatus Saganbacteria bacterium]